jgi:putative sterol carrier protein
MRIGFRPRGDAGDEYTIQFSFSGGVVGDCHFSVRNAAVEFGVGAAQQPGLVINTPFDIWMDILTGKRDGQKSFLDQQYTADGDINLLLKMSQAFGR